MQATSCSQWAAEAGCEEIFREVARGAKAARPLLDETLSQLKAGDVLVIWKFDRLGRSHKLVISDHYLLSLIVGK